MSAEVRTREFLHLAMWTLLGLMGVGLVLVPILRPSILWTSLIFGWSNVLVAYMTYRMVTDMRRRERALHEGMTAPPVVAYVYEPEPRRAQR